MIKIFDLAILRTPVLAQYHTPEGSAAYVVGDCRDADGGAAYRLRIQILVVYTCFEVYQQVLRILPQKSCLDIVISFLKRYLSAELAPGDVPPRRLQRLGQGRRGPADPGAHEPIIVYYFIV